MNKKLRSQRTSSPHADLTIVELGGELSDMATHAN